MAMTRSALLKYLKIGLIIVLAGILISYAAWRSFNYAKGPAIEIFEPANGASIASSSVIIKGKGDRVNDVTLNGAELLIDEEGYFSRQVVIFPGMNILTLTARDQFERKTVKEIRLFGKGNQ